MPTRGHGEDVIDAGRKRGGKLHGKRFAGAPGFPPFFASRFPVHRFEFSIKRANAARKMDAIKLHRKSLALPRIKGMTRTGK
jgi:hypothetical protein